MKNGDTSPNHNPFRSRRSFSLYFLSGHRYLGASVQESQSPSYCSAPHPPLSARRSPLLTSPRPFCPATHAPDAATLLPSPPLSWKSHAVEPSRGILSGLGPGPPPSPISFIAQQVGADQPYSTTCPLRQTPVVVVAQPPVLKDPDKPSSRRPTTRQIATTWIYLCYQTLYKMAPFCTQSDFRNLRVAEPFLPYFSSLSASSLFSLGVMTSRA